jgi:Lrp/AsnC family transcriptional regulator, leucine-responsive regulatory protein
MTVLDGFECLIEELPPCQLSIHDYSRRMAFDSSKTLDEIDWQLLETLQQDGRISFSELGRRVAMSAPAVAERVRRLEEAGVITGYRAQVDLDGLGYPILAVVRLRIDFLQKDAFDKTVAELPHVLECLRTTGDDCFVMKVAARTIPELESAIDSLAEFGATTTSVVVSRPLEHRVIGPHQGAADELASA